MLIKKYLFLLYLFIFAHAAIAENNIPSFFTVNYKLYSNDTKIGLMERKFYKNTNNDYVFSSESKTTGLISLFRKDHIIEISNWYFINSTIAPLNYTYQHTGGKKNRDVEIKFNWNERQIINRVNDSVWYMKTQTGILDKLLYQLVIMIDLKAGYIPEKYVIADGGKIKEYTFEYIEDEIIKTPIGDLNTMKLSRYKKNKQETFLWCAYDLDFLPVKVITKENDGRLSKAIIKSLSLTLGPRAIFIRKLSFFIFLNSLIVIKCFVSFVNGQSIIINLQDFNKSNSDIHSALSDSSISLLSLFLL